MKPDIGDIVEIVKGHHLKEFFPVNCLIDDKVIMFNKTKYHIKYLDTKSGQEHMTWVFESEIDLVSHIREEKLRKLGIG